MALHPLAQEFAAVAEAYERGRPDYPPAAVGALAAELALAPGAPVLDLGAGTGKLSRALLAAGFDVVAVEPQGTLRDVLAAKIGSERVREGVAEAIPLADRSVAAVTVADAFHWFDQAAALREIRRVLSSGGGLAIVRTIPDWSGASWAHELGTLVADLRPAHPNFDGPPWQQAVRDAGGFSEPREIRMTSTQPTDPARIVDHMASMSWIAALPSERRTETLARMRAIVDAGETPSELPIHILLGVAVPVTENRGRERLPG
jgi:SAM-dependent methyltransferase